MLYVLASLVAKELNQLRRDVKALVMILFMPLIVALMFGYGSFMAYEFVHIPYISTAVWFPWELFFLDRLLRRPRPGRMCGGGEERDLPGLSYPGVSLPASLFASATMASTAFSPNPLTIFRLFGFTSSFMYNMSGTITLTLTASSTGTH